MDYVNLGNQSQAAFVRYTQCLPRILIFFCLLLYFLDLYKILAILTFHFFFSLEFIPY